MDFLPRDLAENLIPYEPDIMMQTGVMPVIPDEALTANDMSMGMPEVPMATEVAGDMSEDAVMITETPVELQYFDNQGYDAPTAGKVKKKKKRVKEAVGDKEKRVPAKKRKTIESSYVEKKSSPFKDKFKYTVIVVPENRKGHFRPVFLGYTLVNVLLGFFLIVFVLLFISGTVKGIKISKLKAENEKMQATIESMETNMIYLTSANASLNDKVEVLSETVKQKSGDLETYVKDEESKMTPTGFPFAGQAALRESTETGKDEKVNLGGESESKKNSERKPGFDLEGYPITIFTAGKGTKVIATANGRVKEVAADLCFGNRITVEHSNGMISIYRCPASPKVSVKQDVNKGDTLYETQSDGEMLGYQIIKGNEYIDPLEMMDIVG